MLLPRSFITKAAITGQLKHASLYASTPFSKLAASSPAAVVSAVRKQNSSSSTPPPPSSPPTTEPEQKPKATKRRSASSTPLAASVTPPAHEAPEDPAATPQAVEQPQPVVNEVPPHLAAAKEATSAAPAADPEASDDHEQLQKKPRAKPQPTIPPSEWECVCLLACSASINAYFIIVGPIPVCLRLLLVWLEQNLFHLSTPVLQPIVTLQPRSMQHAKESRSFGTRYACHDHESCVVDCYHEALHVCRGAWFVPALTNS